MKYLLIRTFEQEWDRGLNPSRQGDEAAEYGDTAAACDARGLIQQKREFIGSGLWSASAQENFFRFT